ncbi:MAG: acyltransferase family protein [Rhodospirillaceae bacterium]
MWTQEFLDINPPSWSISVEFWIYLGFGLLLILRWVRPSVIAVLAIFSGLVLYIAVGQIGATLEFGIFRCACGFFTGVFIHWLYQAAVKSQRDWSPVVWLEVPVVVGVIVFVIMAGPSEWSLLAPCVFGLTVWVFAFERGPVSRLMMSAPIRKLGDLSYTIYMTHSLVAVALADGLAWIMNRLGVDYRYQAEMYGEDVNILSFPNDFVADLNAFVYLGLVVAAAAVMSRWVEVPCRDWFGSQARRLAYQR